MQTDRHSPLLWWPTVENAQIFMLGRSVSLRSFHESEQQLTTLVGVRSPAPYPMSHTVQYELI